jgi:hypothetical protein
MTQYSWATCPAAVRSQIERFVPEALRSPIVLALEVYRSEEERAFDADALEQFGASMEDWLRPLAAPETA